MTSAILLLLREVFSLSRQSAAAAAAQGKERSAALLLHVLFKESASLDQDQTSFSESWEILQRERK